METRANYVLIGVCTLLAIIGGLGFFVWLARFEVNRQYDYYDVIFDSVSGLSRAGDVRFNGLTVGQVTTIDLSNDHPGRVRVRIEVAAGTPITEDTTAQLAAQGVTGVSYVALTSGREDSPLLARPNGEVPEIIGRRSVVETLAEDAPDIVTEALALLRNLQALIGPANQAYVANILSNLDRASSDLQTALNDFSSITRSVEQATGQIGQFTGRLESIGSSVETTLTTADDTLKAAQAAFVQAETTLASADGTLGSATAAFDGAKTIIDDQIPGIVGNLSDASAALKVAVDEIGSSADAVLGSFGGTAHEATARLTELKVTLAALDSTLAAATTTLEAVDTASQSFTTLVDGEGTALVADARTTLANANRSLDALDRVITDEVPVIVADVRTAVANASRVIAEAGEDVSSFTGGLAPLTAQAGTTLDTATQTLKDASVTLKRLDAAMDTAERTLAAAEGTFAGAQRVIDEDVSPTAADIRAAAAGINASVEKVAADLPAVTADLRTAIARANAVIGQVDTMVARSAGPVNDFTQNGLPQVVRFTAEARSLVTSLEQLVRRLERDPAGLILSPSAPVYRR